MASASEDGPCADGVEGALPPQLVLVLPLLPLLPLLFVALLLVPLCLLYLRSGAPVTHRRPLPPKSRC